MLWIQVKTNKLDVFKIPFPLDRAQLNAIMAADYPDAQVVQMDIKA